MAGGGATGAGGATGGTDRERGFALLVVLWTLVLVSLLILRLTEAGRAEARLGVNLRAGALAEADADGALAAVAFRLSTTPVPTAVVSRFTVGTAHGHADIRVSSEAGKVDLNSSSPPVLAGLIAAVGGDQAEAARIAGNIVGWRTAVPPNQEAEANAPYRAAGLRFGPPGANFETVDEARLVLGMTNDLFDRLAPHLTVYGSGDPSPALADPVVARALALAGEGEPVAGTPASGANTFDIFVDARAGGGRFVREAVVSLAPGENGAPWRVLTWTHPADPAGSGGSG